MNYTFTNREEYLAYRQMWKAEYRELTKTVRAAKRARLIYQQMWSKAERECKQPGMYNNWPKIWNLTKEYLKDNQEYQELNKKFNPSNNQYWTYPWRDSWRKAATTMLEELKSSKAEAKRQYSEEKMLTLS